MSDTPKKKGGKLPIVVAVVLVLAGGGYFAMKGTGGKAAEEEVKEAKLGHIAPVGEFLVNMADGRTYLRTNISLHFDETFDTHAIEETQAAIQDAIVNKLSSQSLEDVRTLEGKRTLKWQLAAVINAAMESAHGHEKKGKTKTKDEKGHAAPSPPTNEEGWDSDEGPVLKVYFTSFVTQ
ncbi:MAG: flagellar basal body-associated FliL family protein [Fimbriimonadaceae bacterium]|nr:flagellar basal body-associated FliL family protein [Fimbriimonadaceae bacterium]